MQPRRLVIARLLRVLVVPLAVALPPLFWVVDATRRASLTTLGRDQGIFQYVAWALAQGQRDYRDIRDVNGPLTHLVHSLLLALGGADEHRFHVLDLVVTGATFALAGACLPGLRSRRAPDMLERTAWALAAWVVLSGQYLLYGYWDIAQRESFFDWFLLPAVALQLVAQAPSRRPDPARRQARLLALVGALSVVPWFGKPTYVLFTLAQLLTLWLDDGLALPRRKALRAFALGGALGAATQLAFLFWSGDARAFAKIQLVDVPAMYRFIWPRAAADILSNPWSASQAIYGFVGCVVILALVLQGEMPRRTVGVALLPVAALGSVLVQAKGFPYHFHPVTAGVHLQWLVFLAWLGERTRVARRDRALMRLAPMAAGVVVALHVATSMEDSPQIRATWLLWGAATPADRSTREYFAHFPEPDFFPYEMRQTADYLRAHTGPADRVQTYGMDPYVLFLAGRLSATPYIYVYDLDADAALGGGTGGHPDDAQSERIKAIRDAHEADLLARLEAHPPAAFVFLDASPLMTRTDAWDDFETHCFQAAPWVRARYRESARFGHDHVWLRLDLAPPEQAEPDEDHPPEEP
ncbi:MAG TPA: hypothetical protein VIF15_17885 [Polyangiaceae bacterium]|jgi:hypothetical protein